MTARALTLTGYGLNSEEETAFAFELAGFQSDIKHINDVADAPEMLKQYQALAIPGGFSYGDDTGSGNAFAQKMRLTLGDHLKEFVTRDTLTIGICNGCQISANLGLAPAIGEKYGERQVAVTHNASARYQCRWIDIATQKTNSPWLTDIKSMHIPVAHGEGRFMMDDTTLKTLQDNNQIALRYTKDGKAANGEFPYNPNGATDDIAGLTDPSGRVLILMPHPERGMFTSQRDDYAALKDAARREGRTLPEYADGMALFENARKYFQVKTDRKIA
jgi:phosphoribosylformylglycinamidine synthase